MKETAHKVRIYKEVHVFDWLTLAALVAVQTVPAASAPSAPQTKVAASEDAKDRVICRKERQIGSKVATRKICMTVRDRNRATDTTQREFGDLIQRSTGGATPQ
jgi:hypothetical protein